MALGKALEAGRAAVKKRTSDNQLSFVKDSTTFAMLDVSKIHPDPDQPRKIWEVEEKESLKASIKSTNGCKTPIRVRPHPDKPTEYMIIFGEGRHTCHSELGEGFELIPSLIEIEDLNDELMGFNRLLTQVTENVVRFKMKAIHEAESYQNLIDLYKAATGKKLSQDALSKQVGVSRSSVARTLALLKAPDLIKDLSLKNVSQNTNALAYLEQISRLVSDKELTDIVNQFEAGELDEKSLQRLVTELKQPKKEVVNTPENEQAENSQIDVPENSNIDEYDRDEDESIDSQTNHDDFEKSLLDQEPEISAKSIESFDVINNGEVLLKISGQSEFLSIDEKLARHLFKKLSEVFENN